MPKNSRNNIKIAYIIVGFILSLIFAILIFFPQSGNDTWIGTTFIIPIYGYTWIIPIVGLTIGFSNDKNRIRKILRNKYWIFGFSAISAITIIISWNIRFSNDLFFILCWVLTTLWWLTIYFRMKLRTD